MLTIGSFALAAPWFLVALASLPLIWWLLRATPPTPQRINFPAIRFLFGLQPREETPAHTPWWLMLLRLVLATLVILAVAHPILNPDTRLVGNGPLVLVVDNGWAAAPRWQSRVDAMNALLDQAERESRPVVLVTTAAPANGGARTTSGVVPATELRGTVKALNPLPWPVDRQTVPPLLDGLDFSGGAEVVWLSDGLADGRDFEFAERLQRFGALQVFTDPPGKRARLLAVPRSNAKGFEVSATRTVTAEADTVWVRASAADGRLLGRVPIGFAAEGSQGSAALALPTELRNEVARIEIEGEASAGAVALIDERWRRRPVGLVSGGSAEQDQPLLSELYYLERALSPRADVRTGNLDELMKRQLAVMVLADIGQIRAPDRLALAQWIDEGGVLVRFAGPRLAEGADDLIPARLRGGGRAIGGALSWRQPASLAPFPDTGPFFGLEPPAEVTVHRQVLAEPSLDLDGKTWARLTDGTPLVTGSQRGDGWVILFHTTANTGWSNLALSGLFVQMLDRIVQMSAGVAEGQTEQTLPPLSLLDGYGSLGAPRGAAGPLAPDAALVGPQNPPGFYGHDEARRAFNLADGDIQLQPLPAMPGGVIAGDYLVDREIDLRPWLLLAALVIGLADTVIGFSLRGLLPGARRSAAAGLVVAAVLAGHPPAEADEHNDALALEATLETRLAYVYTGNPEIDEISRAGMVGLTRMLGNRTSVEPGQPIGVDVESDELLFFPLLYWRIIPEQPALSDRALAKLDAFMKTGGTILFDTGDQQYGAVNGPGGQRLGQLLEKLNIPPLLPVPPEHVLTKAFYLMQDFPGRWAGGQVWVEAHGERINDGVSSLIVGGNDWAGAWAIDGDGRPMAAVVPGGPRQREMAFRFGINLVMYALTGNYKADQVHVPAILERLGQ